MVISGRWLERTLNLTRQHKTCGYFDGKAPFQATYRPKQTKKDGDFLPVLFKWRFSTCPVFKKKKKKNETSMAASV